MIIKAILFAIYCFLFNKGAGKQDSVNYIFTISKDYTSYVQPAINLVDKGSAYELMGDKKLFAHKMPGMVPILAPLYFVFGYKLSLTILVLLQFLLDALCSVLLAKIALKLTDNMRVFKFTFFIATFSTIVSVSSHYAVSELFCTCFSIISIYFAIYGKDSKHFLASSFFASWSIFFRPTSILLLIIIPLLLLLKDGYKLKLFKISLLRKTLILFFVPFIFFESLWITRNYFLLNRFIPAEISQENFGTPGLKALIKVVMAMGGDCQSWNPDSEMRWFNEPGTINYDSAYAESNPFPSYALKNGMPFNELQNLRAKYYRYNDFNISRKLKLKIEDSILVQTIYLVDSFKKQSPISYYLISPLRNIKTFLFIKRPYGFSFASNGVMEKMVRLWHFVFYYLVLVIFIFSIAQFFLKGNFNIKLIFLLSIGHIILYGIILRLSENRYLVPVYPFMIISGASFLLDSYSRVSTYFSKQQRFINKVS